MSGVATTFFDLPGLHLHAAVAGPEDGPLAVLLHGFPEFWWSWHNQIGPLAEAGYRVIAPDQRGYNLTDKTPPYDIGTLVDDILHLLDACGRERACVAGHDWGAGVAWALASAYPERVARLAILNVPHGAVMRRALAGGNLRQVLRSWYIGFFQIPRLPEWLLGRNDCELLADSMRRSSGAFAPEDIARYRAAWRQPGALPAMLGWYRALPEAARRRRTVARYAGRISVPTLMLWGERDIALGVELAEESTAWLDDGRLIRFPGVTHWVQHERPDEVTRYLLAHFGRPAAPELA